MPHYATPLELLDGERDLIRSVELNAPLLNSVSKAEEEMVINDARLAMWELNGVGELPPEMLNKLVADAKNEWLASIHDSGAKMHASAPKENGKETNAGKAKITKDAKAFAAGLDKSIKALASGNVWEQVKAAVHAFSGNSMPGYGHVQTVDPAHLCTAAISAGSALFFKPPLPQPCLPMAGHT